MLALSESRKAWTTHERKRSATALADAAVNALIQEAELTPKPGLVDGRGPGIHKDMDLAMLRGSALALRGTFFDSVELAYSAVSRKDLRAGLGVIGRAGEQTMLLATRGINTHRGAIWTLGLLCAGAAILGDGSVCAAAVCAQAGGIAQLPDPYASRLVSHGWSVRCRYGSRGARGEAEDGFPHLIDVALPDTPPIKTRGRDRRPSQAEHIDGFNGRPRGHLFALSRWNCRPDCGAEWRQKSPGLRWRNDTEWQARPDGSGSQFTESWYLARRKR